ncbi:uncharacterized protein LOC123312057 [Coccinella septempunctata]|uniref:uncharacterized protein LOC123312057 n=1 Tax=Coccinella septempunctata TaxID=41139 RepID=UPI001D08BF53|nr:uncharacterized protein LOC123312057 [Coccinella septempunctata]
MFRVLLLRGGNYISPQMAMEVESSNIGTASICFGAFSDVGFTREQVQCVTCEKLKSTNMTMDVSNRKVDLRGDTHIENKSDRIQMTAKASVKRPFDVAFLMLPDEKMKQKKLAKLQERKIEVTIPDPEEEDEEIEVGDHNENFRNDCKIQKFLSSHHQKQQIFDDPGLIKAKNLEELRAKTSPSYEQRSAFTKVNLANKETNNCISPALSISPDLTYQHSLSPSPPIRTYQNFSNNLLPQSHLFKTQANGFSGNFDTFNSAPIIEGHHFLMKTDNRLANNLGKVRPIYRPELAYNYGQFPTHTEMMKMTPTAPDLGLRNPAAAILTSLLPPSLAALSLPAQNVCAKCNISFRMTSDLVYHMRSHHKNDSVDMNKKKREDKLKCPVCAESFRERHHLTRHMTAHQDKEEDDIIKKKDVQQ